MTQEKKNGNIVAIITMFFIFAMISFVTNLAAPFGTIWPPPSARYGDISSRAIAYWV